MASTSQYVQVYTNGVCREVPLSEQMALQLLQGQYGRETGLRFFVELARGISKCASVGNSMIEFRGDPLP